VCVRGEESVLIMKTPPPGCHSAAHGCG
jgi:hypothetical protein